MWSVLGIDVFSSLLIFEDKIPRKNNTVVPNPIVIIIIELRLLYAFKFLIPIFKEIFSTFLIFILK